ncbi:MAG: MBOAT family protein, partial [Anaerolineales bacterium]
GRQKAEQHYGYLATYVMFYPQLVAGPIERPQNVLHQFHTEQKFDYQRVADGLKWMAWGMFKKVVIADRMALFVNPVYDAPNDYSGPALLLATLAFAIQIYCDFSGYSDIALGSAQVMGIKLMKNFDHPYFSKSVAEFWRRWHISLSTWFRDYLYIPLGGNRVRRLRWMFNLFVTFLVSGLWHGANWTFVIWGALHGTLVIFFERTKTFWMNLSKVSRLSRIPKAESAVAQLSTFALVSFAWIFFRAASLPDAITIMKGLFTGWDSFITQANQTAHQSLMELGTNGVTSLVNAPFKIFGQITPEPRGTIFLTLLAFVILFVVELRQFRGNLIQDIKTKPIHVRLILYAALVTLTLTLGTLYVSEQQAFIYFQF